jgi:hypothetical protein
MIPLLFQVTLECIAPDGTDCRDIEQPDGMCSSGSNLQTVKFKLNFCTCNESVNTQSGFLTGCEDFAPLPEAGSTVRVTCLDVDSKLLFSENVVEGDDVVMSGTDSLPGEVTCSVFATDGTVLQKFMINTSGQVDLFLKDKFGSLELLACDDKDCVLDLTYTYTVFNTGSVSVTVTKFESERDGETSNLLLGLEPTEIPAGSSSSQRETDAIDICVDAALTTIVKVEAFPPSGPICPAEADYTFTTAVGCRVDVQIDCMAEDGTECNELVAPQCSQSGMTDVIFQYVDSTCAESAASNTQPEATCTDVVGLPAGEVSISCSSVADGTDLTVEPSTIGLGDEVVISSSDGSLIPAEVHCVISDPTSGGATVYQEFSFFTQGAELNLKDKFGSLELERCQDETGSYQACEVLLWYTYDLSNVGTNNMHITSLVRTRDGATESLLDLLDMTNLQPGDEITLTEKEVVDLCQDEFYITEVSVEAEPPNGLTCFDEAEYNFTVQVGCKVDVTIDCTSQDGTKCNELAPPENTCTLNGNEAMSDLTFQYVDSTCKESAASNTQPEATCIDLVRLPAGEVSISCSSAANGTLAVEPSTIGLGDEVVISSPDGSLLPAEVHCVISDATSGGATVYQEFSFFTQGAELNLKDRFGGFELQGCTKESSGGFECIQVLTYVYSMANFGTTDINLTLIDRTRNNMTQSLLGLLDETTLSPGQSARVTEQDTVDICLGGDFTTTVAVEADPPNGITCFDSDQFEFGKNPALSTPPTLATTLFPKQDTIPPPMIEPTLLPTEGPIPAFAPMLVFAPILTFAPEEPIATPFPNPSPSPSPSETSTDLPSASPSESTSRIPSASPITSTTEIPSPTPAPAQTAEPTSVSIAETSPETTPETTPLPTPGPIPGPTPEPIQGTIPEAIPRPTPEAIPRPTPDPNPEPSPGQTLVPAPGPALELIQGPALEPTPGPTPEPILGPTPQSTPGPTLGPILPPSAVPRPGLTSETSPGATLISLPATTNIPTEEFCEFELEATCIAPDGTGNCNATPPPVEQCSGRPFEMVFLFNGRYNCGYAVENLCFQTHCTVLTH